MARYALLGAIEGTYGEGSVATTPLRAYNFTYSIDRGIMFEENIDYYIPTTGYGGALKVSGTLEANLRRTQQAVLIEALLGNATTLGVPKSCTMSVGEQTAGGSHQLNFFGVGIKSASFQFRAKEFVKARYEWLAKNYTSSAYSAPAQSSYSAEEPCVFYKATIDYGGSDYKIKEFNLDIDRKLDDDRFVVGDYQLHELGFTGMTKLSGSFTFTEQEYDEFRRAIYGSTSGSALDADNKVGGPTLTIDAGGFAATCGVSIYSKADVTLQGQDQADKKIDYEIIGDTFALA